MSIDIVVPDLGESVSEATIASWLVAPGDAVAADQPIVELETDKVNLEIGSPTAGVFVEALVAEGEDVKVGAVLGRVEEGEGATAQRAPREATEAAVSSGSAAAVADAAASPPAQAMAWDPSEIGRSGEDGSVTVEDLLAYLGQGSALALARSGPAVRKLVADHGLDPAAISALGRDGRITIDDVQQALATPAAKLEPATAIEPPAVDAPREERVKLSRMRRTIATRLKEAQNTAAILTTFNEVDMGAVMALRAKHRDAFETRHGVRLGFTSFFAKACVAALRDHPAVNAEIDGDEVIYKHYYDIGMAVSTPNGLVVPVIRSCDSKSFADIEKSLGDLASRAKDGALSADDMQGGTFSITNGGVFGSLLSTPILNRPQSAILGLHKIEQRPMAVDGEVVVRPMMYVALSYDHRIIDGREAVTFLVKVKECIEEPESLMLDL